MIIWFSLIIPILSVPILYYFFKHKVVWWEFLIPFIACFLFIGITKFTIEKCQIDDVEYWTGYIVKADYQEPWREEWNDFHPAQYNSKGECTSPARMEHHIVDHPPYWSMIDNNNITQYISKEYYAQLVKLWKNNHREEICHFNQTSYGDGGIQWTSWDNKRETIVVLTTKHHYENRIQASHSVFKFPKIEDKTGLFEYPKIKDELNVPSILGAVDPANSFLSARNAEIGKRKQVRIWILVFKDKSLQTAIDQESYWMGGNKNEFVVCVGVDKTNKVKWCYVFSWTEVERLKINVREFVLTQQKMDLMKIANYTANEVDKLFIRKNFSDFNYLTVEPPNWAIIMVYIITFLITGGISTWSVLNEFEDEYSQNWDWRQNWQQNIIFSVTEMLDKISNWGKR